ncbi:substrate-binding domain-containing protein [Undibacterium sp. 5I2]|nr:substrate-binding domain-containing protein [Undibacterium sp. 5I2]
MKFAGILGLGVLCTLFCACGNTEPGSAGSASTAVAIEQQQKTAAATPRIALVLKTLSNPFFIAIERGARRAAAQSGVVLEVRTAAQETAIEQQIAIVDELIEDKVPALVIAPSDSQRLLPVLQKAQQRGMVIINIDNPLDSARLSQLHMQAIPFVSVDNEAASYAAVKAVLAHMPALAEAALIEGMPGAENGRLRSAGARRALREHGVSKVAAMTAHWKIDEAYSVSKDLFRQHPHITLLFCANDMMALGAVRYLQESGRTEVAVIGYDAIDEAKQALRSGAMVATVDQAADEQGYQGVMLALRALKGETLPARLPVAAQVLTAELLKQRERP